MEKIYRGCVFKYKPTDTGEGNLRACLFDTQKKLIIKSNRMDDDKETFIWDKELTIDMQPNQILSLDITYSYRGREMRKYIDCFAKVYQTSSGVLKDKGESPFPDFNN